jgi:hypothetical protein
MSEVRQELAVKSARPHSAKQRIASKGCCELALGKLLALVNAGLTR